MTLGVWKKPGEVTVKPARYVLAPLEDDRVEQQGVISGGQRAQHGVPGLGTAATIASATARGAVGGPCGTQRRHLYGIGGVIWEIPDSSGAAFGRYTGQQRRRKRRGLCRTRHDAVSHLPSAPRLPTAPRGVSAHLLHGCARVMAQSHHTDPLQSPL